MTAIPTFGASNSTAATNNSSAAWSDSVTYTFPASSQVANASYAVFWQGSFSFPSTANYAVRVTEGGTSRASLDLKSNETSGPVDRAQQGGFFFFTAAATPADATFALQFKIASGATTLTNHNGLLRIVKLPANSVKAESLSDESVFNTTTLTDKSGTSISVSGDYLFLASAETMCESSNVAGKTSITVAGTSNVLRWGTLASSLYGSFFGIARATATGTAKIQYAANTGVATHHIRNARLLALKVSDFRNIWSQIASADASGTQTTYTTAATTTQTVSAGDHLVLSAIGMHSGSSTFTGYVRLTSGGSQVDEHIYEAANATDPNGVPLGQIMRLETYTAGSRTWTLDRKSESTNTTTLFSGSGLAIIDLDDASGGGGPTTYSDTLTESATAADSSTTSATFGSSASETATATDSLIGGVLYTVTLSEGATAGDSATATPTYASPLTESATAGESETSLGTFASSLSEAGTAGDSTATTATFGLALTENGTAGDSGTGGATFPSAVSEAGTAGEGSTSTLTTAGSRTESAAAGDSLTSAATWPNTLSESAAANDNETAIVTYPASLTETATSGDTVSGSTVAGSTTYNDSLTESATAAANQASTQTFVSSASEAVAATQAATTAATFPNALSAALTASDALIAALTVASALSEGVSAATTQQGERSLALSIAESAVANDNEGAVANWRPALAETVVADAAQTVAGGSIWSPIAPASGSWAINGSADGSWNVIPAATGTWG